MSARGRPATGKAMSAAERKRASRERRAASNAVNFAVAKTRKPRSDSVAAQVAALVQVDDSELLPPPEVDMSPGAMPFWHMLIVSRPAASWSESDRLAAAALAQVEYDLAANRRELAVEKHIILDRFGSSIVNPRFAVVDALIRQSLALRRTLGFVGKAVTMANANMLHQQARATNEQAEGDDLLA